MAGTMNQRHLCFRKSSEIANVHHVSKTCGKNLSTSKNMNLSTMLGIFSQPGAAKSENKTVGKTTQKAAETSHASHASCASRVGGGPLNNTTSLEACGQRACGRRPEQPYEHSPRALEARWRIYIYKYIFMWPALQQSYIYIYIYLCVCFLMCVSNGYSNPNRFLIES